jgi:hypothetical protein
VGLLREKWAMIRVLAFMWWCGDYRCDCTQPVVERITPRVGLPPLAERLWEGPFISRTGGRPEDGEVEEQWRELLAAAQRFDAERQWNDEDVPAGFLGRKSL